MGLFGHVGRNIRTFNMNIKNCKFIVEQSVEFRLAMSHLLHLLHLLHLRDIEKHFAKSHYPKHKNDSNPYLLILYANNAKVIKHWVFSEQCSTLFTAASKRQSILPGLSWPLLAPPRSLVKSSGKWPLLIGFKEWLKLYRQSSIQSGLLNHKHHSLKHYLNY